MPGLGYQLVFRVHALQRMFERGITERDIRHVLATGDMIMSYPDDTPYPSRLVLGWLGDRPLHVVAADDDLDRLTIIITAYEPDPALWDSDFRSKLS